MIDFFYIADILATIRDTGSTLAKRAILEQYADEIGFKEILKFIYDPGFVTGLKQRKLDTSHFLNEGSILSPEQFMEFLKKHNTGSDYAAQMANGFIYSFDGDEAQWLAEGMATKNLQIGVSVTTLNDVFGKGFIPRIGIMRGKLCPEKINGKYIVTEKIDGNRRLIKVDETGTVEVYTRSGKRDYGLVDIEEQAKHLPWGYMYDSECVASGIFEDSIALRQASASILNSKGTRRGVDALLFDIIPLNEYGAGRSAYAAIARKAMLATMFDDRDSIQQLLDAGMLSNMVVDHFKQRYKRTGETPNIMVLPILGIVQTRDEGIALAKPIWEVGGEGVMLVEHQSPYEVNPNPRKTLLKIKLVNEYVCRCIGVEEGTNKYEGMLGAIVVEYIRGDSVYEVKVGSGFTDFDRSYYWEHPDEIIGKDIEIESFGESRNAQGTYSLNCPIFKRIVGDTE